MIDQDPDDDLQWIDALAGRGTPDSATRREAQVLRRALREVGELRESQQQIEPQIPDQPSRTAIDPARERALLDRAAREGLLPPRAPRPRWPLALAASLVLAAGLGIALRGLQWPEQRIERGADEGPVRLTATNPASLKQAILRELRAAGVDATGYEALNVHGIDADLPMPLSDAVRRVLRANDIPEPADGVLRIEIRSHE